MTQLEIKLKQKSSHVWEENYLSPLAMKSKYSRGRKHKEKEHPYRSIYQRDRDRIIHSAAFRRLEYKTQVFVYHEGDYYRTRLTHTLEVAQIARTIARTFRLNEDLIEAISLAHDLGHTPFGHAVEGILDELLKEEGGFNHNIQGLRVVDFLEERYPRFRGLNLSWETREGIVRHNPVNDERYLKDLREFNLDEQPTMETQVMDVADEIAYDSHDLDDGIKSGMISEDDLKKIELWQRTRKKVEEEFSNLNKRIKHYLIIREIINLQVTDIIQNTRKNIKRFQIKDYREVRKCNVRIVSFSKLIEEERLQLRNFLFKSMYAHWRVVRMSDKAKRFVTELFNVYLNNPDLLPQSFRTLVKKNSSNLKRIICDYIAGMTDRYALTEYKRLFDPYEKV